MLVHLHNAKELTYFVDLPLAIKELILTVLTVLYLPDFAHGHRLRYPEVGVDSPVVPRKVSVNDNKLDLVRFADTVSAKSLTRPTLCPRIQRLFRDIFA